MINVCALVITSKVGSICLLFTFTKFLDTNDEFNVIKFCFWMLTMYFWTPHLVEGFILALLMWLLFLVGYEHLWCLNIFWVLHYQYIFLQFGKNRVNRCHRILGCLALLKIFYLVTTSTLKSDWNDWLNLCECLYMSI